MHTIIIIFVYDISGQLLLSLSRLYKVILDITQKKIE